MTGLLTTPLDRLASVLQASLAVEVEPHVQDPYARYTVSSAVTVLKHMALVAEHGARLDQEDAADIARTLEEVQRILGGSGLDESWVSRASSTVARAREDAARAGLDELVRLLAEQDHDLARSTRAALRGYMERHVDRQAVLASPTFIQFAAVEAGAR